MSFFAELKRRNVFKVGIAYVVASWLILQLTEVLTELMQVESDVGKIVIILLIVGFIPALIFAWAFELTPEGVRREKDIDRSQSITSRTGRRLDFYIMGMLVLALGYFIWESRFAGTDSESRPAAATPAPALTPVGRESSAAVEPGARRKSVAVLPFTNRSPNPDDIYFTDGVHDDLLTQLAKIGAFSVISRTSVMEYRDTAKNLKEIATELGVANVMEGAVQRAGNRVRINVQLIDAATDEHLWAEVYDRQLTTENLFDIQSEIAQAIAGALHATLTESELASVADVPTESVEAYELYLQANRFSLGETEIGYDTAIDLYNAALSQDPRFKLAWVGLARAHITNYWQYGGDPGDREKSRSAIDRARAIDPDFPELYMAEGFYWYWGHLDYDRAIENLERAVVQMPGNAEAHMWLGWASRRKGQWERAVEAMGNAVRLDPRVVINLVEYSNTLAFLDRMSEARAVAQQVYALDPNNYWAKSAVGMVAVMADADAERAAQMMIGAQHTRDFLPFFMDILPLAHRYDEVLDAVGNWTDDMVVGVNSLQFGEDIAAGTLYLAGRRDEARQAAESALRRMEALQESTPYDYRFAEAMTRMHGILGNRDEVARLAAETLAIKPPDAVRDPAIRYTLAIAMARVGMTDEALELLAYILGVPGNFNANYMRVDPQLDLLRDDPAFNALLEEAP